MEDDLKEDDPWSDEDGFEILTQSLINLDDSSHPGWVTLSCNDDPDPSKGQIEGCPVNISQVQISHFENGKS